LVASVYLQSRGQNELAILRDAQSIFTTQVTNHEFALGTEQFLAGYHLQIAWLDGI
jgi:hypothetical protein